MENKLQIFLEKTNIIFPPIGVYDVQDTSAFAPFVEPEFCIFSAFNAWMTGKSTMISKETAHEFGCSGAGFWLCGVQSMPPEHVAQFLAEQEGLKADQKTMLAWLANCSPYEVKNSAVVISQLLPQMEQYLQTVTFFITPDQLALLLTGAQYHSSEPEPSIVMAPFGSGCAQMLTFFQNADSKKAIIGATDIAMRKHLPANIIAFTMTPELFRQIIELDENSFLDKSFWQDLKAHRSAS